MKLVLIASWLWWIYFSADWREDWLLASVVNLPPCCHWRYCPTARHETYIVAFLPVRSRLVSYTNEALPDQLICKCRQRPVIDYVARCSKWELRRPPHQPSAWWQSIFCCCSQSLEQSTHRPQDRDLLNGRFQTTLEDLALQTGMQTVTYRPLILQLFYQCFLIIIIIIVIIILIIILSLPFHVMRHRSLLVL